MDLDTTNLAKNLHVTTIVLEQGDSLSLSFLLLLLFIFFFCNTLYPT